MRWRLAGVALLLAPPALLFGWLLSSAPPPLYGDHGWSRDLRAHNGEPLRLSLAA